MLYNRHVVGSRTELEALDEEPRARQSLAALENWARQARRSILFLVDNLDLVIERLSPALWALRETLSLDNRLVMIGTSPRLFGEAIDYQSPFYDFFHVHELGPLSEDEALAAWCCHSRSVPERPGSPKCSNRTQAGSRRSTS
jgi:hypothetical protein